MALEGHIMDRKGVKIIAVGLAVYMYGVLLASVHGMDFMPAVWAGFASTVAFAICFRYFEVAARWPEAMAYGVVLVFLADAVSILVSGILIYEDPPFEAFFRELFYGMGPFMKNLGILVGLIGLAIFIRRGDWHDLRIA